MPQVLEFLIFNSIGEMSNSDNHTYDLGRQPLFIGEVPGVLTNYDLPHSNVGAARATNGSHVFAFARDNETVFGVVERIATIAACLHVR